jgi:hypothetical protein
LNLHNPKRVKSALDISPPLHKPKNHNNLKKSFEKKKKFLWVENLC